jgi:hypothetical protein
LIREHVRHGGCMLFTDITAQKAEVACMFVCKNDLECPENKDFDEHYHSFEKCEVCGKMTTCAECLCGRRQF